MDIWVLAQKTLQIHIASLNFALLHPIALPFLEVRNTEIVYIHLNQYTYYQTSHNQTLTEGFEPPDPLQESTIFKTAAFTSSATLAF